MIDCPVVCFAVFDGTDGSRVAGSGCTVALNTASQKWTITPDAEIVGAAGFTPDGVFHVDVSAASNAVGAAARVFLTNFTAGDALEILSIDPATGLAANYDGELKVLVRRLPTA